MTTHPLALFQPTVCTWWAQAKFKHTVPDSSSQPSHYPWCAEAPGEEPAKSFTFSFPWLPPQPTTPVPTGVTHFVVYISALLASLLLCPKNRKLKVSHWSLPLTSLFFTFFSSFSPLHTHTRRCFCTGRLLGEIEMFPFIELWLCWMSEDGNVW